jgi:hypothetical protein
MDLLERVASRALPHACRLAAGAAMLLLIAQARPAAASIIVYQCASEVCAVDPSTMGRRQLTQGGTAERPNAYASISRDGRVVGFTRDAAIYTTNLDAASPVKVADGFSYAATFGARMSPAGTGFLWNQLITFAGRTRPYTYSFVSGGPPPASIALDALTYGWLGEEPVGVFSPGPITPPARVCVIGGGGDVCDRQIVTDPARLLAFPDGSPDGSLIVAIAEPPPGSSPTFEGSVALYSAASGTLVRDITAGPADRMPVFSPDGTQVAFQRDGAIWIIDLHGGAPRRLVDGANPDWGGGALAAAGGLVAPGGDTVAPRAGIATPRCLRGQTARRCAAYRRSADAWRVLRGTASDAGAGSGVERVDVNLVRARGRRCEAYAGRRFRLLSCARASERFTAATVDARGRWRLPIRGMRRGAYALRVRAVDRAGNVQSPLARRSLRLT